MEILLAFAFISGIITILSPCILPVLPIVLTGGLASGKARPFGVLAGFAASFTFFTLTLSAIVRALGIPPTALRIVAVVFIIFFGAVMLVPGLRDRFESLASRVASLNLPGRRRGSTVGVAEARRPAGAGFWSGLPVGLSLGLIWTPCVGPIMASVISLAVTRQVDGGALFITLAYTLGTSIPMLAVMLGGRALLNRVPWLVRNTATIQKVFGVVLIVVGLGIGLGWDLRFQSAVLAAFPGYGAGLIAIEEAEPVREALGSRAAAAAGESAPPGSMSALAAVPLEEAVFSGPGAARPRGGRLGDYGLAPPLLTGREWFNTGGQPLTMEELRGKVVLVDFWTYSCINCVRTIPYLRSWYETYKDSGFVIIGVHSPEFEFEKSSRNVARAIEDLGVSWPVVLDNDFGQWNAYRNLYWPAHYFIDAAGRVRYFHFGEGRYEESEKVIQDLLQEARPADARLRAALRDRKAPSANASAAGTPETYLGYQRSRGFVSAVETVRDLPAEYRPARRPVNAEWNLQGRWTIARQYIVPEDSGVLELGFRARNVFLVVEPEGPGGTIEIRIDGRIGPDTADVMGGVLRTDESRLYQLVGLEEPGEHVLSLKVEGRLRLFAFTFG